MTEEEYRSRMNDLNNMTVNLHSTDGTYKLFTNLLKSALSVDVEISKANLRISYLESRIKALEDKIKDARVVTK